MRPCSKPVLSSWPFVDQTHQIDNRRELNNGREICYISSKNAQPVYGELLRICQTEFTRICQLTQSLCGWSSWIANQNGFCGVEFWSAPYPENTHSQARPGLVFQDSDDLLENDFRLAINRERQMTCGCIHYRMYLYMCTYDSRCRQHLLTSDTQAGGMVETASPSAPVWLSADHKIHLHTKAWILARPAGTKMPNESAADVVLC